MTSWGPTQCGNVEAADGLEVAGNVSASLQPCPPGAVQYVHILGTSEGDLLCLSGAAELYTLHLFQSSSVSEAVSVLSSDHYYNPNVDSVVQLPRRDRRVLYNSHDWICFLGSRVRQPCDARKPYVDPEVLIRNGRFILAVFTT